MNAHHRTIRFSLLTAISACLFATMVSLATVAPASGLPPRPATITPTPTQTPIPGPSNSTGAHIELHVSAVRPGLFTAVQWRSETGQWFTVEGWQGELDDVGNQTKTWWVAPRDGNTGPFHWIVYDRRGGQSLGVSEPFTLPVGSSTLNVYVSLNAH